MNACAQYKLLNIQNRLCCSHCCSFATSICFLRNFENIQTKNYLCVYVLRVITMENLHPSGAARRLWLPANLHE